MPRKAVVRAAALTLKGLCFPAYRGFVNSLSDPRAAQDKVLRGVVADLSRTAYGRSFGIEGCEDYAGFAAKIPVTDYDKLEPWIERQVTTRLGVITPHRVVHVEPTSGSSGIAKQIPYTKPLLAEFSRMFRIWAYDLLAHHIAPETGRIFMSVSAAQGEGFADDRSYLPAPLNWLLSPFLLMPPRDMHGLAMALAAAKDLEVISVWSPSYLLAVIEYLEHLGITPHWPRLKLISCWDSALAAPLAEKLRSMFPGVLVQGKGLLATEGPLTVPLAGGYAPLAGSVFFEFEMPDGSIRRLHELRAGERAEVIVSQRGGLTRYRLGDIVEAGAALRGTPSLRFLGRSKTCDLAGEKLNEVFVREALSPLLEGQFFLLAPLTRGYVLLAENPPAEIAAQAEAALSSAYHYGLARKTGQLMPLEVRKVGGLASRTHAFQQSRGMKAGNIKDSPLMTDPFLARRLLEYLSVAPDTVPRPASRTAA